jgi:protein gp37
MGEKTGIQWTDHTFNPWWGCEKVSPACKHCYAETFSKRLGLPLWGGADTSRRMASEKTWSEPVKWNKAAEKTGERKRVFCASMADVFEDRADLLEARARLFRLVTMTPSLDWLLLTKRPEHVRRLWSLAAHEVNGHQGDAWPANVWLGTTVEDQEQAEKRIPYLLDTPAAVRFLSVEPMLGAIDLTRVVYDRMTTIDAVNGLQGFPLPHAPGPRVDWVIVGGESGPKARPFDLGAARRIVADCKSAGVAAFVKQLGERWARDTGTHREDAHGGTPELWPEDLRVREMPAGHR